MSGDVQGHVPNCKSPERLAGDFQGKVPNCKSPERLSGDFQGQVPNCKSPERLAGDFQGQIPNDSNHKVQSSNLKVQSNYDVQDNLFQVTDSHSAVSSGAAIQPAQPGNSHRVNDSHLSPAGDPQAAGGVATQAASAKNPTAFDLFQTTIDVDDVDYVDAALEKARELNCSNTIWKGKLLHLEYSARKKLHIDIRMPMGMTIEETQKAYCEAAGIPYDKSCITPERIIFITDKDSEMYRSKEW